LETYHIPFSPDEMEELFFGRSSQCVNDIDRGFLIFPEAKQVLESLKASGVQLACCSSSSRKYVEDTLKQGHLEGLFDFILAGDDKILPKPNPDVYLRCLKHFGLDAEDVLVVEDSALGLAAAKAAGLRAAARFNPNMPLDQSAADWIISDLSEIFSLH
jgi:HAD superfamily hydrolase (TIGR01509 family)